MSTKTYPGKGLSLSQLVFALNEELKRTAGCPSYVANAPDLELEERRYADHLRSFTLDEVSHLERDTSIALATIREWKNMCIPIGRTPPEILSYIFTHLSSQNDRFRASSVCRHWRRTLLQCAELWSELRLSRDEFYVKTLLERAKGYPLDVIVSQWAPVSLMKLLCPHFKQIGSLHFKECLDIQKFSEIASEPLPLLHSLTIRVMEMPWDDGRAPLPPPLLSNAVNLEAFHLHSESASTPSLSCFFFPNLVSFYFSACPWEFHPSQLFDFLEASPMLRTVHMRIIGEMSFQGIPKEKIVILPNVKNFNLTVSDSMGGYRLVAYISCPSVLYTTIAYERDPDDFLPVAMFPPRGLMNVIVRRYTRSPAEEAVLDMTTTLDTITCTLTFRSSDATVTKLCFTGNATYRDDEESVRHQAFDQAARRIEDHPWANIKRLRICHGLHPCNVPDIAGSVERLFKSLGPLDELIIYRCDIQPFFPSFLKLRDVCPITFPPIKELAIHHPASSDSQCTAAIARLAKSHHTLEIPFERVIFRAKGVPSGMEERVRPWVGSFEYYCDEREFETGHY